MRYLMICSILILIFQRTISYKLDHDENDINVKDDNKLKNEEASMKEKESEAAFKKFDEEVMLSKKSKRTKVIALKSNFNEVRISSCVPQPIQDCKNVYVDGELKYVCTIVGYTVCN